MKNLIAFILIAFFSGNLMSNNIPENNSAHVYAFSGLKLRVQPNMEGAVLKVIPYGDKVQILGSSGNTERIEWMSGEWVQIIHEGTEGFIFSGFISHLPLPKEDFELTRNDLDLSYPLLSWTEHNFDEVREPDTIQSDYYTQLTQHLENGITLTRRETSYDFTVILELPESKIEDAYHLVQSMLLTKPEKLTFSNKSLFVENIDGEIHRIKIPIEHPVEFRKMKDGSVKILITSFHTGC